MIKFLVDSSADCKREEGIYDILVPMTVTIDGTDYHPGVDLDTNNFYDLLIKTKDFPKTSQPSPQMFLEHFEAVKKAGDELICFCIASALSGTYQSAVMAKEMADYDKIHVIDTLSATHMIGIMVHQAAKLRQQGCAAERIVEEVEKLKSKIHVLAGLDTLEYLRRGGRIGGAAAFVGSMAQIKPILTVSNGRVEVCGKAIGKGRAIHQIADMVQAAQIDPAFPIISIYSLGEENCAILEERLSEVGIAVSKRLQIGSTIGAHTGPGVYGVIFVTK